MFQKHRLANGVTTIVDSDTRFRSVALAICLRGGLTDEQEATVGVTHFLEHLLFKRTARSDAKAIACRIDELGSEVNAFTDTDSLCLYGLVPAGRLEQLMDFFAELLLECAFNNEDLEREREVIRQEILETGDSPPEIVGQALGAAIWPNSILRFPVFGTIESIQRYSMSDVQNRFRELCVGSRMLIAACGNVEIGTLDTFAEKYFSTWPTGSHQRYVVPQPSSGITRIRRRFQQVYVTFAHRWPGAAHDDYIAGLVFAEVMGRGMSSRLFQLLREERGVAYDVSSDVESFGELGILTLSAVVEPKHAAETAEAIVKEMAKIRREYISEDELSRVFCSVTAQVEMEQDSLGGRLWRAVESEIALGRYLGVEEVLGRLQALTRTDVCELIDRWLTGSGAILVLGGETRKVVLGPVVEAYCSK